MLSATTKYAKNRNYTRSSDALRLLSVCEFSPFTPIMATVNLMTVDLLETSMNPDTSTSSFGTIRKRLATRDFTPRRPAAASETPWEKSAARPVHKQAEVPGTPSPRDRSGLWRSRDLGSGTAKHRRTTMPSENRAGPAWLVSDDDGIQAAALEETPATSSPICQRAVACRTADKMMKMRSTAHCPARRAPAQYGELRAGYAALDDRHRGRATQGIGARKPADHGERQPSGR